MKKKEFNRKRSKLREGSKKNGQKLRDSKNKSSGKLRLSELQRKRDVERKKDWRK